MTNNEPKHSTMYSAIAILHVFLSICFCLAFFPAPAMAADVRLLPYITVHETYDDNVSFSRTHKEDDYFYSFKPGFTLDYGTQWYNIQSEVAINVFRYINDKDLNTENYLCKLNGGYQVVERWTLSGNLSFLKDTTLDSELEETGIVNVRSDRERYDAGMGLSYQISERFDMGVDYIYASTNYDRPSYVDYDSNTISLSFNRRFNNQLDVFTVRPYYSQTQSDVSKMDNYVLSFGWAHPFSETLRLSAFLGPRYTIIERTLIRTDIRDKDTTWGGVADINLTRTGETSSAAMGYNHSLLYDSYGEPINRYRIYLNTNYMVTKRFGIGFSGSLYFTKSEGKYYYSHDKDSQYFQLSPSLSYKITENHLLRIAYSYSHNYDKTAPDDQRYDRSRVWIALDFKFPQQW